MNSSWVKEAQRYIIPFLTIKRFSKRFQEIEHINILGIHETISKTKSPIPVWGKKCLERIKTCPPNFWLGDGLISWPTNQPINQPTNQPTHQPTNPPTHQPTNQPTNQPTHQPTSQPIKKRISNHMHVAKKCGYTLDQASKNDTLTPLAARGGSTLEACDPWKWGSNKFLFGGREIITGWWVDCHWLFILAP